jgi:NADPH:quinone reductase-like Zn-dependent oxidoreductase
MEGAVTSLWATAKNYFWPQFLGGTPRKYIFQQTNPTQERLEYLVRLVKDGKLKVIIDQVYDMEDGLKVRHDLSFTPLLRPRLQAYERILSQRAKGKVVVKVQNL